MTINLNQRCDVILTAHGAEVYNKYFRKLHAICHLIEPIHLKAGVELSLQLWELMNIFGKHLYNGAENCFENNDISFNDKVVNVPERSREEIKELLDNWEGTIVAGGDISISPWISVEDKLPEITHPSLGESDFVFVHVVNKDTGNEWIELPAKYNERFHDWITNDFTWIKMCGGVVTHWMPIPQIPKEERK